MTTAVQRAQSRPGRMCSFRARSCPQRQVAEIGPRRGTVRTGRPLRCGSVRVGRPVRGRTEAVYRCIEIPGDELDETSRWARTGTYCYLNAICFTNVS
jgi:hypothetical protein